MNIAVIIPTFNRESMLLHAINSVMAQSLPPNEIIVVDDGSTDNTKNLFPISGVIYHRIEHTGFPGFVRNIGVDLALSEYIAFLDSDDLWHNDKLKIQAEYFENNSNCKILHTKELWLMNNKVVSQKKRKHKTRGNIFKDSLQGCIIGPSTVLMEKKLFLEFNGFNKNIEIGEDYDLWLRICNTYNIDYIDNELITKIAGHNNQLSFKYGYIEPFKLDILENLLKTFKFSNENRELVIKSIISKYEIIINGCTKRRKFSTADMYNNRKIEFLKSI